MIEGRKCALVYATIDRRMGGGVLGVTSISSHATLLLLSYMRPNGSDTE